MPLRRHTIQRTCSILAVVTLLFVSYTSPHAMVRFVGEGVWPDDWPEQLEPFRKRATTFFAMTGEDICSYQIPFESREEFETLWPVLLELKSKGAPIKIWNVGSRQSHLSHAEWNNSRPLVRIVAPPHNSTVGYPPRLDEAGNSISSERMKLLYKRSAGETLTTEEEAVLRADEIVGRPIEHDIESMKVNNGLWLRPGPPWPDDIRNEQGELPERVQAREADGRLRWVAQPTDNRGSTQCRIELELVVDGEIIDLDRLEIPADTPIIDKRAVKSPPFP